MLPEKTQSTPGAPASLDRALRVRFGIGSPRLAWGASWAFVCGVAAAGALPVSVTGLARLAAAWFVAAPLLGAVWAPLLGTRRPWPAPLRLVERTDLSAPEIRARLADLRAVRLGPAEIDALLGAALALTVSGVLSAGVLTVTVVALGVVLVAWALRGRPPSGNGRVRSLLEIAVPALVGWSALGGGIPVPAPLAVSAGPLETAVHWLAANWLALAVIAAFTMAYHGVAGAPAHADADRHARLLMSGYVVAVVALAAGARPFGASLVALLLVAQWPLIVAARSARVHRYGVALQVVAMTAMVLAAISVGWRV